MNKFLLGSRGLAVLAIAAGGLTFATTQPPAAAAGGFCSPDPSFTGTTITWTGKASSNDWDVAKNWSPRVVPDAHHTPATYQNQYVCIGKNSGGGVATVQITKHKTDHVAGIDIGNGATLTVEPGAGLFLGAKPGDTVVPSFVRSGAGLQLLGGTLGGNSPLNVAGTLRWTGLRQGKHKIVATQTSSECAFDPSIKACPGDKSPGGGSTIIASGGKLLVDGTTFGGTSLSDGRAITNSGTLRLTHNGYITMDNGTRLTDAAGSSLALDGPGGIYQGATTGHQAPQLRQKGPVVKDGNGVSVVGVPVSFSKGHAPHVRVRHGGLSLQRSDVPVAKVVRAGMYGVGGCTEKHNQLCRRPDASKAAAQVATIGTSSEAAAPKVNKVGLALVKGPKQIHGKRVLGQATDVSAPTVKTTHSTHLTFSFDATTKGLPHAAAAPVYRNKHRITVCRVHGLTAKNTSCVLSEKIAHSGPAKGDLTVIVISIQPKASWLVAK
jgi:hypothetical protein